MDNEIIGSNANDAIIFDKVFENIENVFRLVQPKDLLFIAIDGVAPRAKWNQQRQRRYLSY